MSLGGALFLLAAATDGQARTEIAGLLGINESDPESYQLYAQLKDYLLEQNNESYLLNIGPDAINQV